MVAGGRSDPSGRVMEGVRPGEVERLEDTLTGYHYRTSSRFGEYMQVRLENGEIQISGRRISVGAYYFFIGLQVLLMALIPVALVAAALLRDWRWGLAAVGLFVAFSAASTIMAGGLWENQGLAACTEPATLTRVAFPVKSVSDVRVGPGWSRNRLGWVIWPVVKPIDGYAMGHAVSFEAPDPVTGKRIVYAIHMYNEADASRLAAALQER